MFEKINLGNNEKMNSSESWQPCMWRDYPEDTCADLGCIFCDGNKDDIIGN